MGNETHKTFSSVLQQAGISPKDFRVGECDDTEPCSEPGPVRLYYEERGRTVRHEVPDAEAFFRFVDRWLKENPGRAARRGSNPAKLFQPLSPHWVLVDYDEREGPDGILFRRPQLGWHHFPPDQQEKFPERFLAITDIGLEFLSSASDRSAATELLERGDLIGLVYFLHNRGWLELGLKATPEAFSRSLYGYALRAEPTEGAPGFVSPFYEVGIRGQFDRKVPWSDPYLLAVWHAFLAERGVQIDTETVPDSKKKFARYTFQGFLMLTAEETDQGMKYVSYDPHGEPTQEKTIPDPPKRVIRVERATDPRETDWTLWVGEHQFPVKTNFSHSSEADLCARALEELGRSLEPVPDRLLKMLAKGKRGAETPLKIYMSDKETATEMGWIDKPRITEAQYSLTENYAWIPHHVSFGDQLIFHEILGHALDDFLVPMGDKTVTQSRFSALSDYDLWKVWKTFSSEEIEAYEKLIVPYWKLKERGETDGFHFQKIEQAIGPFREKVEESFVTSYALEGHEGIRKQLERPSENFAEVASRFYRTLLGLEDSARLFKKEPLAHLMGLLYLMEKYDLSRIGAITKREVFSHKAFREVLGIDLGGLEKVRQRVSLAVMPSEGRRAMARRYARGPHLNLRSTTYFDGKDYLPSLSLGLEAEWGRQGKYPLEDYPLIPFLHYSLWDLGEGTFDSLGLGLRLYTKEISLEASVERSHLLVRNQELPDDSFPVGAHLGVRWFVQPFGVPLELGFLFGYLRERGEEESERYHYGLSLLVGR